MCAAIPVHTAQNGIIALRRLPKADSQFALTSLHLDNAVFSRESFFQRSTGAALNSRSYRRPPARVR